MHRPQLCKIVILNDSWVSLFYRGNLKEYFIYIYIQYIEGFCFENKLQSDAEL